MNDDDDDEDDDDGYRVAHSEGSSIVGRCSHSPPWPLSVWRHSSFGSVVSHVCLFVFIYLSEFLSSRFFVTGLSIIVFLVCVSCMI